MEINKQALYRKLSEPHASREALVQALEAFWDGVKVLREQHGLPNVAIVIQANILHEEKEQGMSTYGHLGDRLLTERLLAWALGEERAVRDAALRKLAGG